MSVSILTTIVVYQDGSPIGQVNRMVQLSGRQHRCSLGGRTYVVRSPYDQPHVHLNGPLPRDLDTEGY